MPSITSFDFIDSSSQACCSEETRGQRNAATRIGCRARGAPLEHVQGKAEESRKANISHKSSLRADDEVPRQTQLNKLNIKL